MPDCGEMHKLPQAGDPVRPVSGVSGEASGPDAAVSPAAGGMTWRAGVDGGDWFKCYECDVTTPPTEQGRCATCGSVIVPWRCERGHRLVLVNGTHYAPCEDCYDGEGPTFDDALAGSLAAIEAQHDAAKVK